MSAGEDTGSWDLLAAASAAADARAAGRLGVRVSGVDTDFAAVMGHVHGAIATIELDDSPQGLKEASIPGSPTPPRRSPPSASVPANRCRTG